MGKKSNYMKRLRNNMKSQFILLYSSQLVILILTIFLQKLVFATCDDTVMVAIAGGGYGAPNQYIINMHIIIGYALKILFSTIKGVNWITIFYLFTIFLSFFHINRIIVKKVSKHPHLFLGSVCILDISFIYIITHFTFTVVAYASVIAGTMCLFAWLEEKKKSLLIHSIILIFLGALIRADVLATILISLFFIMLYKLLFCKNIRYLIFEVLVFGLFILSSWSNRSLMNINPIEKAHLEWGELRSKALDCAAIPYDETKFDELGISLPQYYALYNAFYYSKEAVSEEVLNKLLSLNNINNRYNFDIISFFLKHFSYLKEGIHYSNLFRWIFALVFFLNIILGTKDIRIQSFLIYLGTICTEFVYHFIQREPFRIVMPTFILGICLLLFNSKFDYTAPFLLFIRREKLRFKKIYKLSLFCFLTISLACY